MKIGFIGLGNVGGKLAGSLLRNGFDLTVRDLDEKTVRPFIEKVVTLGKKGDLSARRKTMSILQDEKMTKKIFDTLAARYNDRNGGYTRIIKLGNRYGDNAPTAVIEFVDRDEDAKGLDSGPVIEKKTTEEEQLPQN